MEDIPRHSPNQNWRVKVYLLNPTGNWDDCGAGTLDIVKEVKLEEEVEFLKVGAHDEFSKNNTPTAPTDKLEKLKGGLETERNILYLPILMDNQYDHQGDTIISWIDRNIDEEIALSFLEPSTAKETWRVICARIGRNPNDDRKYKDYDQLMMPNMENLDQIKYDFETKKDWMVGAILENKGFMDKLFQVFRDLEDLESLENLHIIYAIIRLMIFSEDVNLLELLLSDEYYLLVFGALEYDSDVLEATRPKYREFLQNQSFYKKVIDFQDETVLKKIRLNYRISYLKDTVITSIIDDPISSQFNPISYVTNRDILEHIMSNDHYFDELFEKMISNPKDAVGFLYDLTQIVKLIVQMEDKLSFGRKLVRKNVFTAIAKSFEVLDSPNQTEQIDDEKKNILKINLVDTLVFIMQLELPAFIDFLKSSSDSKLMITGIINNLFHGDQGLQIQTGELIKFLIDITHDRKDEILEIFYENFMPAFVEHYKKLENNEKFYSFVQQLVEVLIHCIKSHEYRIRHYILHHKLLHKMNPGFKSRDKSLHLALIRLIKHIVLSKDEFLIKYISHNNLLDDLFEVYFKNAFRNNLVNSACLELVQLIQHENIRMLIVDITEKFRDKVREYSLERFFKSLFDKYDYIAEEFHREMSQESVDHTPGTKLQISTVIGENFENYNSREISYMEDEEYFEAEDDEDENAKSKGLSVSDKSNLDFTQKILDQVLQQPIITEVSEQQIKSSKDCLQKMKEKLVSRKLEAEEDNKFSFGNNRGRNRSSSTERPNFINIQLSMPSNENVQSVGFEPAMGKRAGIDLGSDDETREDGKVDPQKKIKI